LQKTKPIVISVLAALLVCSALSVVAAQEETPTTTPSPDSFPPAKSDPDSPVNDNSTVTDDTPILYGISDNSTDTNTTDPIVPDVADGELMYANGMADEKALSTPDNTWIVAAIGVVLAVVVGGVISVVYVHKTKAKS
jgi:hypothetical protein